MAIVENIKRLADMQNKSISQIERDSGLGNGTIGKWNNSEPTISKLMAVADELGCSISELIGG